ncbi:ABC transporter permease [Acetanaerobacterium elongatum]|nr:FtsX-like permease family protein [Acetanaerobacterium elongatum]
MKNALLKDSFRELRRTLNRFLSIFAIVALGTGFFAGVKATSPDMWHTADRYYDDTRLEDIRLVSTLGFDEDDIASIRQTQGVQGLMPAYTADALVQAGEKSQVLRLHSYPVGAKDDENLLNKPVVLEGRLPEHSGECVTEIKYGSAYSSTKGGAFSIGSTVSIYSGTDKPISDSLKVTSFKVVGAVMSPYYIAYDRGTTTIGNGKVNSYLIIPEEDFNLPVYTDVYVTVNGAREALSYSDDYNRIIEDETKRFEQVAAKREQERYDSLVAEGTDKLNKAKEEYADGKKKAEDELAVARKKLNDAKDKLADGWADYNSGKAEFDEKMAEAQQKLDDGYKKYGKGLSEFTIAESEFETASLEGLKKLKEAEAQVAAGQAEYEKGLAEYNSAKDLYTKLYDALAKGNDPVALGIIAEVANQLQANPSTAQLGAVLAAYAGDPNAINKAIADAAVAQFKQTLDANYKKLQAAKNELDSARAQISQGYSQLMDAEAQLNASKNVLESTKKELDAKSKELKTAKAEGDQKLSNALKKLTDGEKELADGEKTFSEEKSKADKKLADAYQELQDGESKLKELKPPKWYILDRDGIPGNSGYYDDTQRIDAISKIFPVFFFLVAALVCLTTMTRMVEEQRTQIGTIKALGYGKWAIASKFLLYAVTASLLGSIAGLALGFKLFPWVITSAYAILYDTPAVQTPFIWSYALPTMLIAVLCTGLAALLACYKELAEQPVALMRPKAPKAGKRVLLERITPVWRRLSFTTKVTVRNLLRYRRRMLMTVLGIGGCTALMLTGFGLKNSISDIVAKQFGELYRYDATILLDTKAKQTEQDDFNKLMDSAENVICQIKARQENITVSASGAKRDRDATLFVPEAGKPVEDFIVLRDRKTHAPITLGDDGVVITEKLSLLLGVHVGDSITLRDSDNRTAKANITAITENYAFHYVYMKQGLFESLFNSPLSPNTRFCTLSDDSEAAQDAFSERLLQNKSVLYINYCSSIKKNFQDILKSMNAVVLVLIVSAGALAFIVLYNLTNINVTERIREIATIKVLGFFDKEVSAYIYRENMVLTLLGIVLGLGGGILLHQFVVVEAEIDMVMFGREIGWLSYLLAAALTLVFTLLVNLVLHFRLKKVSMVESLKSLE